MRAPMSPDVRRILADEEAARRLYAAIRSGRPAVFLVDGRRVIVSPTRKRKEKSHAAPEQRPQ